jgi:hypothetical protein
VPEQEPLASLIGDLRSLRGRDRRAVLAALSESERARIAALSRPRSPRATPAAAPQPLLSEWLQARLDESPEAGGARVTVAARQALRAAAGSFTGVEPMRDPPRGRSLLGALGSFLAGRGAVA